MVRVFTAPPNSPSAVGLADAGVEVSVKIDGVQQALDLATDALQRLEQRGASRAVICWPSGASSRTQRARRLSPQQAQRRDQHPHQREAKAPGQHLRKRPGHQRARQQQAAQHTQA